MLYYYSGYNLDSFHVSNFTFQDIHHADAPLSNLLCSLPFTNNVKRQTHRAAYIYWTEISSYLQSEESPPRPVG